MELVHSRFRVADRTRWRDDFLNREACRPGADLIVVATQVVEAGVDLSAGSLVTELAPWSSLVQRFGRCARYGGTGQVHVVDRGSDRDALPYEEHEMNAAREALSALVEAKTGAGIASLEDFEAGLGAEALGRLYPYEPSHLLLRREFEELFDTTPDLTGADLDIGRYIRSGDERDLLVCWREIPRADKGRHPSAPPHDWKPHRGELCAVPFLKARDWLCGKESKDKPSRRLRNRVRAWIWDWLEGCWAVAERTTLLPGRVVCVASEVGGYRPVRGFDPESTDRVPETQDSHLAGKVLPEVATEESDGCDELSVAAWKTIGCHGREVAREAEELARTVGLPGSLCKTLALAGLWHDVGKSHPAFQGSIRSAEDKRPERQDLAKAPPKAWLRPAGTYRTADDRDHRPGLRHELASALALFAVLSRRAPRHPALLGRWMEALELAGRGAQPEPESTDELTPAERAVLDCTAEEFDLLAYLVASHHGKVRVALHAGPRDQEYPDRGDGRGLPIRGVREGDELPALALGEGGPQVPAAKLTLEPAALGLSLRTGSSWRERTLGLAARFGPAGLAWLEALLIAADRRASRLVTPDPQLAAKAEVAP
ncbi:MAG: CRISPR-associated endonuclease Cas3'' [Candidatus Wallbacteria bacterium]|nr:CRISPR-associated endonuclease Cas3'' [Candidatus Wallbacteria bacterium]